MTQALIVGFTLPFIDPKNYVARAPWTVLIIPDLEMKLPLGRWLLHPCGWESLRGRDEERDLHKTTMKLRTDSG